MIDTTASMGIVNNIVDSYSEWAGSLYAMSAGTSSTVYASWTFDWISGSYTYDTGDKIQEPCKSGVRA